MISSATSKPEVMQVDVNLYDLALMQAIMTCQNVNIIYQWKQKVKYIFIYIHMSLSMSMISLSLAPASGRFFYFEECSQKATFP